MSKERGVYLSAGAVLCLMCGAPPVRAAAAERMGCSPQTLTPDSTLTLTLPWPHEGLLEIKGPEPEEAYYTVIAHYHPKPAAFRPIIAPEAFERKNRVSLKVKDIVGDDQDPQKGSKVVRRPKSVFTISGVYTLYMMVINKDEDYKFYTAMKLCRVNYIDPAYKGPRPKRNFYSELEGIAE